MTTTFGQVTVTSASALSKPVVVTSPGYTMTGFGGARITGASVNFPPVTQVAPEVMYDNSQFVASVANHPMMLNLGTGDPYPLGYAGRSDADVQPSIYGASPRVVTSEYDPITNARQIFSTQTDGEGRVKLTSDAGADYREPVFAPNRGLIFVSYSAGVGSLYRVPIGTTTPVQIFNDGVDYRRPVVSPDGTKIAFTWVEPGDVQHAAVANADGTGSVTQLFGLGVTCKLTTTWLPNGDLLTASDLGGSTVFVRLAKDTYQPGIPMTVSNSYTCITAAPDGTTVALSDGSSDIYALSLVTGNVDLLTHMPGNVDTIFWGPYANARHLVGTLANNNTVQASGFLVTQAYSRLGSYVLFDATTPSGVTIDAYNGALGSTALVCTVEASDELTMLKYTPNGVAMNPRVIVTPAKPVKGAIVTFNAEDGTVSTIITYSTSSSLVRSPNGNTLTFTGNFDAVWNGKGENERPNGAQTVKINATNGKILSIE